MRFLTLRLVVVLTLPLMVSPLMAQNRADEEAINRLIDRYGELGVGRRHRHGGTGPVDECRPGLDRTVAGPDD
jgi:hypothetical protein